MPTRVGAFPDSEISRLIAAKCITGVPYDDKRKCYPTVRPSSLDLTIEPDELYFVRGDFQPQCGETVREVLAQMGATRHRYDTPLSRGSAYVARIAQRVSMPHSLYGYTNPKSTTGRNDILTRLIADGVPRFDTVPRGFSGELWVLIQPGSYPVLLGPEQSLIQMRVFNADTRMTESEQEVEYLKHCLLYGRDHQPIAYRDIKITDNDGSLHLTVDLKGPVVGYECRGADDIIDLAKVKHYEPGFWFNEMRPVQGQIILHPGGFYVLASRELVVVPPDLACEMVQLDSRTGHFISHQAGYIDPGWGLDEQGQGTGQPLVMEVTPIKKVILRHGQPIAKLKYERMTVPPDLHYGQLADCNYRTVNALRLAKQFRENSAVASEMVLA
ncbi:MAG: 2'-deoxycytidine 5'-triphosphate deaminase [Candidatus Andersenbacteria bacterium]